MTRKQKGFTLIELLIVVAIIGILAAIAIPNLLTAMQRSRQKRTMADMRTIATSWESRATDVNSYIITPGAAIAWADPNSDISAIEAALMPTYMKKVPQYDGWGTRFMVGWTTEGDSYAIQSYGADKKESFTATSADGPVTTANFDCDIVFSEGNFVVYPEGVQTQ